MTRPIDTTHVGGARHYVEEVRPDIKVPGVTSIIGMLAKPFLAPWNAKLAAELAVDSVEFISRMEREGAINYLKNAAYRYTKSRATIGSKAHDEFERLIRGQEVNRVHQDITGHVANFREFLDVVQPKLISAEDVAWSDTHQYAGSYDGIIEIRINPDTLALDPQGEPARLMVDWKTGKSTYPDVALQMAAYAYADRVINPEGVSSPMPDVDGAAVLHVTDKEWSFKPVRIDQDVFDAFLALRAAFEWDRHTSRTVLGKPWAKSGKFVSGTERRAR